MAGVAAMERGGCDTTALHAERLQVEELRSTASITMFEDKTFWTLAIPCLVRMPCDSKRSMSSWSPARSWSVSATR